MPKTKLIAGVNDLEARFPEVAAEADGWDPSEIFPGSKDKKDWKCKLGHTWDATPNNRTSKKTGCPVCAGKKLWVGFNDLQTKFPEVAKQAHEWDPTTVVAGHDEKKDWKCDLGHVYPAAVKDRTSGGTGCPYCSNTKLLKGFNDLATTHPEIAKQAHKWDSTTVVAGHNGKKEWKCDLGHIWRAVVNSRANGGKGCPYCSNNKLLPGFNDLKTRYPEIAKQADNWDPSKIFPGHNGKKKWKCDLGHKWSATPDARTSQNHGCPICAAKKVVVGFNDLQSKYPEIAAEADGWDPTTRTSKSDDIVDWICPLGHKYPARIANRTPPHSNGCPYCSGNKVLPGFNDLATKFPEVAREAHEWDPTQITSRSNAKKEWKCPVGHIYEAQVAHRTGESKSGCSICDGKTILEGFNDLSSKFPELAKEANGWDPKTVHYGEASRKRNWKCSKEHTWDARVADRIPPKNSGCPECSEFGFDPGKDAWFYLMRRPGEQQLGITNNLPRRMDWHEGNGWEKIEVVGPRIGRVVLDTETVLKRWLKKEIGTIPGTTENWFTAKMEVNSLSELKERSGIETDLF